MAGGGGGGEEGSGLRGTALPPGEYVPEYIRGVENWEGEKRGELAMASDRRGIHSSAFPGRARRRREGKRPGHSAPFAFAQGKQDDGSGPGAEVMRAE